MNLHWVTSTHKCKWCGQDLLRLTTTSECPIDRRRPVVVNADVIIEIEKLQKDNCYCDEHNGEEQH